jgi:hypothetical protein
LTILALALIDELAARMSDYVGQGIPLLAAPDFTTDLVLRDSLGTHGRPNGHFQKWILNSAGFRSPESVLTAVPGCTRVMTLGSSETFGLTGESPGQEYPAQLSDSLAGHGCYQVLNAGMAGIGLPSMIQLWNRWASRAHPDIVVITPNPILYLAGAPLVPDTLRPSARPWWTPRMIDKLHDAFPYPPFVQRWIFERQVQDLTAGHAQGWQYESIPADRLALFGRDLDSLLTTVRAHGALPILAVAPLRVGATIDASDRPYLEALKLFSARSPTTVTLAFDSAAAQAVRELGLRTQTPVVDLASVMNGKRALFDDAIHYTDAGAAVVAGAVGRAVVELHPQTTHSSGP